MSDSARSADEVDRSSIEMLEEDGEYTMKVKDSYKDPEEALREAREVIKVIEESDWDER